MSARTRFVVGVWLAWQGLRPLLWVDHYGPLDLAELADLVAHVGGWVLAFRNRPQVVWRG